ncbi:TetR family transcriptional regulator [Nucisporomicrobium flavum]|uniref:TetR/AcrR family transcriptional regulator n=1 Tax=Nucisporomicrobium flavum TaxID=2785915 RepID=UPI0018F7B89C|nr:TetR family transcriptional regulator [Nucisporomicrobium flavum]
MVRRSGRRPGNQDTRQSILESARTIFAERGFDKASIRAIAAGAEVDPALVHHYFGTKEKLFLATMNLPLDPSELVPKALAGPREEAGERLVRTVLTVWDSPAGTAAVALMRSAMSNEWTARLMREFVVTQILRRAVAQLAIDESEAPMRSALVATQIAGLAVVRHVLKVEPVASAPVDQLAAAIGPNVQRYLTGDLPEVFGTGKSARYRDSAVASPASEISPM